MRAFLHNSAFGCLHAKELCKEGYAGVYARVMDTSSTPRKGAADLSATRIPPGPEYTGVGCISLTIYLSVCLSVDLSIKSSSVALIRVTRPSEGSHKKYACKIQCHCNFACQSRLQKSLKNRPKMVPRGTLGVPGGLPKASRESPGSRSGRFLNRDQVS